MFGLIMKIFIGLSARVVVNASNHTKCVCLSNQKWKIQPTPITVHPNEYSQELHYYPFEVKLDRCAGSCKTLNELSNKVFFPDKTEDFNRSVLSMTTGKLESKTLTKHMSCECKCKVDGRNCSSGQKWNNDKC